MRQQARRREDGAVTAETAAVLPMLVAVGLGLAWVLGFGIAQARAVDAAAASARALARGDSEEAAVAAGRRVAPPGSVFTVRVGGDTVRVTVTAEFRGPGSLFGVPGLTARATAVAAREQAP